MYMVDSATCNCYKIQRISFVRNNLQRLCLFESGYLTRRSIYTLRAKASDVYIVSYLRHKKGIYVMM